MTTEAVAEIPGKAACTVRRTRAAGSGGEADSAVEERIEPRRLPPVGG